MIKKEDTVEKIERALNYIHKLPLNTYFSFDYSGGIQVEADTLAAVKTIRAKFGRLVWKKEYMRWANYWVYTGTTADGVHVRITGVKEAPASCKAVTVTRIEKQQVPIGYVEKEVEVTYTEYKCPGSKKAAS